MSGNRGFTLIEVLIALTVLVVAFGVLLDIIYKANIDLEFAAKTLDDIILIDRKVKLNELRDLEISEKNLPAYPGLLKRMYRLREVFLIEYELRKQ